MRKILFTIIRLFATIISMSAQSQDTTRVNLDEIVVSSFYSSSLTVNNVIDTDELITDNYGQEPSNYFTKMSSIISLNDNGTEFGYGYFRIRGLDQTRINVTLDGCPWNEAEDYGSYFANSPDLMSSMHSIKVEKGTSSSYNGIAGVAGGIALESVNLYRDTASYAYLSGGSFGSFKSSIVYNMGNINGWGLHIKATHQQTDGFRDYGFNKSQALTVKTGYKFENATLDVLSMNGFHRNGQGWIGNTFEELTVNPSANGNTEAETDNWFMSMNRLQYKHMFDNTVLTASAYYQFQDGSYRMDLDNYMKRMCAEELNSGTLYDYGLRHNMFGANIAAKHYLNVFDVTYGVNAYKYMRRHFLGLRSENTRPEDSYNNTGYKNDITVFGMITYRPVKSVALSVNVQYRHASFDFKDHLNPVKFDSRALGTVWDFCNFGFNAEYTPVKSVKIYGRFNQVHREPTRSDMFGGSEWFIGEVATIKPERASDFEFGAEYAVKKLYANVNLYYMMFKNEHVLNGEYGLNGLPCHDNADKSYRRGIEAEADWNFAKNLHVRVAASYSDNRVITETFGKRRHILTPAVTFDGDLYYDNERLKVGTNVNYRSSMFVDMSNEHSIPYLFTIELYGSYKFTENIELGLRWNNVTNRVNYCTGAVGPNNETLYFRNAPTNMIAFVKYNF